MQIDPCCSSLPSCPSRGRLKHSCCTTTCIAYSSKVICVSSQILMERALRLILELSLTVNASGDLLPSPIRLVRLRVQQVT